MQPGIRPRPMLRARSSLLNLIREGREDPSRPSTSSGTSPVSGASSDVAGPGIGTRSRSYTAGTFKETLPSATEEEEGSSLVTLSPGQKVAGTEAFPREDPPRHETEPPATSPATEAVPPTEQPPLSVTSGPAILADVDPAGSSLSAATEKIVDGASTNKLPPPSSSTYITSTPSSPTPPPPPPSTAQPAPSLSESSKLKDSELDSASPSLPPPKMAPVSSLPVVPAKRSRSRDDDAPLRLTKAYL